MLRIRCSKVISKLLHRRKEVTEVRKVAGSLRAMTIIRPYVRLTHRGRVSNPRREMHAVGAMLGGVIEETMTLR